MYHFNIVVFMNRKYAEEALDAYRDFTDSVWKRSKRPLLKAFRRKLRDFLWEKFCLDTCPSCGRMSRWLKTADFLQCKRCGFMIAAIDLDATMAAKKVLSGTALTEKLVLAQLGLLSKDTER
jgi:ribosomal protein L37AE/L43A